MKSFAIRAHQQGLELACYIHRNVPAWVVGDHAGDPQARVARELDDRGVGVHLRHAADHAAAVDHGGADGDP